MFLYVCLVLLPATVLASCSREVQDLFFNAIDYNKDGKIQRSEVKVFYQALNVNGDECLTLGEVKSRIPTVAPELEGHEEPLYNLYDLNKDKCITQLDVDGVYILMDINRDEAISRAEYDRALDTYCAVPNIISSLLKILSGNNGN